MATIPSFNLNLSDFQGPLEELYRQIRERQIDLKELNLKEILNQYLEYIMECLRADYSLNFFCTPLTLCSQLILLRSRLALPETIVELNDEDIYQKEDERIKNLVRYNRVKQLATQLKVMQSENARFLGKEASPYDLDVDDTEFTPADQIRYLNKLDVSHLTEAFLRMIERLNYEQPLTTKVVKQETSPRIMKQKIISYCKNSKDTEWSFERFLMQFSTNMSSFITCFLVILDLISNQNFKMRVKNQKIFLQYL